MPDLTVSIDVDEFMQSSDEAGMRTAISFNSESRAQTEAMLVQGGNITLTPAGSGASRTLTIAASGGSSFDPASPGAIGGTTPSTGAFTGVTVSGTLMVGNSGDFRTEYNLVYIRNNGSVGEIALGNGGVIGWDSNGGFTGSLDTILRRRAAGVLALRNGNNAQKFEVNNRWTDASNYERGTIGFNGDVLEIGAEAAGTGTLRLVRLLGIPTADPAVAGCLWNDAGTLKISAG